MTNPIPVLFFVDQPTRVVNRFRDWLKNSSTQCVVVEPIARAFSLVVRDNPWGVVLNIESEVGLRLCSQIREDDLLGEVKIIALSTGSSTSALTEHMFGDSSADVYGKLPLENGIVDVWLNKQLQFVRDNSGELSGFNPSDHATTGVGALDAENFEIELTSDLSVSSSKSRTPSIDERVSRLELELFEQSEKLTIANRNLLKSQLRLRDSTDQNALLQAEQTRLSSVLAGGASDVKLRQEVQRLYERLRIAEDAMERSQQQTVDFSLQSVDSLSPQDLLRQIMHLQQARDEKVEQINTLHGELQLTRQAVETLQRRTKKSETRLAEVQDLGQSREQLMHREFGELQRQVSNGIRRLEMANHRETQFQQQLEQLQVRLTEVDHLHQEERSQWLQQSQKLTIATEKEAGLLLEIEGLTEALQAQLMGESDSGDETLLQSLEQKLKQVTTDLITTQQQLQHVTEHNTQLIEQLSENTEVHTLQGLEKQVDDVISREDHEHQMATVVRDYALQVSALEAKISKLSRQSANTSNAHESDTTDGIQRLQSSLVDLEQDREVIETQLLETKRQVAQLESERVQLQRALEDSQAMADAVEEATDNEIEVKEQQVFDAKASLEEQILSYQELESQTSMVISERDELWATVEPLQQRQAELETQLVDVETIRQTLHEQVTVHQQQVSDYEKTVFEMQQKLDAVEQTLTDSTTELETLRLEADEIKEAKNAYDALEAENQALSEQRQTLLEELKGVETVLKTQRIEIQTLHETINSMDLQETTIQSEQEALLLEKEAILERIGSLEIELLSTQDMLNRVTQENELLESTIVTLNSQIETLKNEHKDSVETSSKALLNQRVELEQQHQKIVAALSNAAEKERIELLSKLEVLEQQIRSENVREILGQPEQVVELDQELNDVRGAIHRKNEEINRLNEKLQILQLENTRLRDLEIELQMVQATCDSLEDTLQKIRTEWSDAQSIWDVERELLDSEQSEQEQNRIVHSTLEEELQTVREHRSQLLETIDVLTKVQVSKEQSIQELKGPADDVVIQLQEERDEVQTELEMMRLEMGIAQSAARQLAQQAERMRRDVLSKQEVWSQKLSQKEAENARLRDKLKTVDQGLSSLFIQRPVF